MCVCSLRSRDSALCVECVEKRCDPKYSTGTLFAGRNDDGNDTGDDNGDDNGDGNVDDNSDDDVGDDSDDGELAPLGKLVPDRVVGAVALDGSEGEVWLG
jgi:hypothetical protein